MLSQINIKNIYHNISTSECGGQVEIDNIIVNSRTSIDMKGELRYISFHLLQVFHVILAKFRYLETKQKQIFFFFEDFISYGSFKSMRKKRGRKSIGFVLAFLRPFFVVARINYFIQYF